MINIPVENQLLLACTRTVVTTETAIVITQLLQESLNWDYLLEKAQQHRIVPLVQRNLLLVGSDAVPSAITDFLQAQAWEIACHNLSLTAELLKLLDLLNTNGISAMPFKGPALAAHVYGDFALRQFTDLDILIRQSDFPKARALLIEHGYQPSTQMLTQKEAEEYPYKGHHEYRLFRHDGQIIELEWQVYGQPFAFPPNVDDWWTNLEQRSLGGRQVLSLSPEYLLLILCVHGSKHQWDRLIWICDIAEIVRINPQLDWEQLFYNAHSLGAERMLCLGLYIAHQLLSTSLPTNVLQRIANDREVARLANLTIQLLFFEKDMLPKVKAKMPLYQLRMLERFKDRGRMILYNAPSLFNPVRIFKTYGFAPLRHLLGL